MPSKLIKIAPAALQWQASAWGYFLQYNLTSFEYWQETRQPITR